MTASITPVDPARSLLAASVARAQEAVASLAAAVHGDLSEALDHVERLRRLADAISAQVLPQVSSDGLWALDGQRSFATWVERRTTISSGEARRRLARGVALRDHLPIVRKAFARGELTAEHVDHIVHATTSSPQRLAMLAHPEIGESFLVDAARRLTASGMRTATRRWAAMADPEAEDRAFRAACARTEVSLARTTGGWHLRGWLDEERGTVLATALEAAAGTVSERDDRTRGQRSADALHTLARLALDSGAVQKGAKIRPHLLVHVPYTTVRALADAVATASEVAVASDVAAHGSDGGDDRCGLPEAMIPSAPQHRALEGLEPATFADGTPLAPSQLMQHLCDGALSRVVFGPDSEPLDVGRERRSHTTAQRKAIIARDRHCQYPGCHAPPLWCEPHHAVTWAAQGGDTNVDDAVLLCWTHHRVVHAHHLTVHRFADRWEFRKPGKVLHGTTPRGGHPLLL